MNWRQVPPLRAIQSANFSNHCIFSFFLVSMLIIRVLYTPKSHLSSKKSAQGAFLLFNDFNGLAAGRGRPNPLILNVFML